MNATESYPHPIEILLVDDDPGDVLLTTKALQQVKFYNKVHTASNGIEALQFLRNEGDFANSPRPDLILLDLNMPRMDGRELLREVKADTLLRRIPVVVLTTSDSDEDILRSYDLQASCYITKPVNLDQFTRVVAAIHEFWLAVVRLPHK